MKPNKLVVCCFSLAVCLSVWQLITGPGPPVPLGGNYVLETPSPFAANWLSDANASFEYPLHQLPADDYGRLIDLRRFEFTILNRACDGGDTPPPLLLILVHSDPRNARRRNIIRQTWGQRMDGVVLLFVLGAVARRNRSVVQARVLAENATHGDFLQGNFADSYRNVSYKHAMVFKYAIYHCPAAKYVLKIDDDVFVNLVAYKTFLHEELSPHGSKDLLFCHLRAHPAALRSYRSKWHVTYSEFRKPYYPDMCPGWSVLYSPDVLFRLYVALQKSAYFWIDDVLIMGMIREQLNISLTDNRKYFLSNGEVWRVEEREEPYLYGPADATEEQIRHLWDHTLRHIHNKPFQYAFAQGQQPHNHVLNTTSSLFT